MYTPFVTLSLIWVCYSNFTGLRSSPWNTIFDIRHMELQWTVSAVKCSVSFRNYRLQGSPLQVGGRSLGWTQHLLLLASRCQPGRVLAGTSAVKLHMGGSRLQLEQAPTPPPVSHQDSRNSTTVWNGDGKTSLLRKQVSLGCTVFNTIRVESLFFHLQLVFSTIFTGMNVIYISKWSPIFTESNNYRVIPSHDNHVTQHGGIYHHVKRRR